MVEIIVSQNNTERLRYAFDKGIITIGRSPSNEIYLVSPAVLERHARLSLVNNICVIQRLAAESAVYVNNAEIDQIRLYDRDVVTIGPFRLSIEGEQIIRKPHAPAPSQPDETDRPVDGNSAQAAEPNSSLISTGVDVLSGPAKGRRILFTGKSAKLGIKNESLVTIRPSNHGYTAAAANHFVIATLNGERLTEKPEVLSGGDLIEFTELKALFFTGPG